MAEGGKTDPCDTPSIRYLQSGPDTPHTCWFLVGKSGEVVPELIPSCTPLLMAHSVPMRNMLYESDIAEKGTKEDPVKIPDVKPQTFKNFAKFIHCNTLPILSFEEGLDLVYVAEKYIVVELITKLEKDIVSKLCVNNVFKLLERPVCLQNQTLKNSIDKVIQEKTKDLFAKEEFLGLSSDELVHIVSQDMLAVSEIELWREILRWAKHKAQSEEGSRLRESLSDLLKYLRLCTIDPQQFCQEVAARQILNADEVLSIVMTIGGKSDCQKYSSLCYELSKRKICEEKTLDLDFVKKGLGLLTRRRQKSSHFFITTGKKTVHLLRWQFRSCTSGYKFAPENLRVECKCEVSVTRITDYELNTSSEQPVQFELEREVAYASFFSIPFSFELKPFNKYKVELKFSSDKFECITTEKPGEMSINNEGLLISWTNETNVYPTTHLRLLEYKTM